MKLFFTFSFFFCLLSANTQSLTLNIGGNFNRTIRAAYPEIRRFTFEDFSPKNGYQAGLTYKHLLYKSFFVDAEISYLNKGHERRGFNKELLNSVNYNYLTFTPSIGYDFPFGFSLKVGMGINHLLSYDGFNLGVIEKTEYALSTTLSYNYKRIGLELSHSNDIKPMQQFESLGQKFENYHEWYAASLSFQIFKKQPKTP